MKGMDVWPRLAGISLVSMFAGAFAYQAFVVAPKEEAKSKRIATQSEAEAAARFNKWAYVEKEKEISPGETLRLVRIPSKDGFEYADTKCLVYTSSEFKSVFFSCPPGLSYE